MSNGINDWGGAPHPYEQMNQAQPQYQDQNQVAEELIEEGEQEFETDTGSVVNEALKRIEQAKLYESLMRHPLFAPGSARQEIMDAVQTEIRTFILERLETLVGLRHAKPQQVPQNLLGLTEEEVSALKVLAGRMIQKNSETRPTNPQVNQLQPPQAVPQPQRQQLPEPVVRPLGGPAHTQPQYERPQAPAQPAPAPVRKVRKVAPKPAQPAPAPAQQPQEEGTIRHRRGQAVSQTHKPLPMPSEAMTTALQAQEVAKTSAAFSGGQNQVTQLLNLAVTHAQRANSNIRED